MCVYVFVCGYIWSFEWNRIILSALYLAYQVDVLKIISLISQINCNNTPKNLTCVVYCNYISTSLQQSNCIILVQIELSLKIVKGFNERTYEVNNFPGKVFILPLLYVQSREEEEF